MYFLYIKLLDITYKEDVFLALQSINITNASYFEGSNIDHIIEEYPLFKGFFSSEEDNKKKVYLVTAVVDKLEQINELLDIIEASGIKIKEDNIIRIFSWKLDFCFVNKRIVV